MVAPIDNQTLLRQTMVTVLAMVGGCVFLVGSLTLIAVAVSGRTGAGNGDAVGPVPGANVHGAAPGARAPAGIATAK
jgi:hypothetical protein